jgi:hypothetical protein
MVPASPQSGTPDQWRYFYAPPPPPGWDGQPVYVVRTTGSSATQHYGPAGTVAAGQHRAQMVGAAKWIQPPAGPASATGIDDITNTAGTSGVVDHSSRSNWDATVGAAAGRVQTAAESGALQRGHSDRDGGWAEACTENGIEGLVPDERGGAAWPEVYVGGGASIEDSNDSEKTGETASDSALDTDIWDDSALIEAFEAARGSVSAVEGVTDAGGPGLGKWDGVEAAGSVGSCWALNEEMAQRFLATEKRRAERRRRRRQEEAGHCRGSWAVGGREPWSLQDPGLEQPEGGGGGGAADSRSRREVDYGAVRAAFAVCASRCSRLSQCPCVSSRFCHRALHGSRL